MEDLTAFEVMIHGRVFTGEFTLIAKTEVVLIALTVDVAFIRKGSLSFWAVLAHRAGLTRGAALTAGATEAGRTAAEAAGVSGAVMVDVVRGREAFGQAFALSTIR